MVGITCEGKRYASVDKAQRLRRYKVGAIPVRFKNQEEKLPRLA